MPRIKRPSSYSQTKIKDWRLFRGLTQEQLAGRLDDGEERLTPTSISRIENGKQGYTQATLEAIARALDVSPADLLVTDPPQSA